MKDNLNISKIEEEDPSKQLKNKTFPSISLPNQQGNLLRLNRADTFRMVIFFFSMTGRPDRCLPKNWNSIPGAKGCTYEVCSFRDNYDKIISLNTIPLGISTQTIDDNKEMSSRLNIPFDILSDEQLNLKGLLKLPFFLIDKKEYLKRLTLIVEKNIIIKVFYPIFSVEKHISEVLEWLKKN